MKKIIVILMMTCLGVYANAQTSKSKTKNGTTKVKHKTSPTNSRTINGGSRTMNSEYISTETMRGTAPSGALPTRGVIIYDSTTSDPDRYNPYRKFTPGESAPDDPAPGLENAGQPRNRLPNTDKIMEPRK